MHETTITNTDALSEVDVPSTPPEAHQRADGGEAGREQFEGMTATYSPEDNKLRLRSELRLGADLYARVKAAGFAWAPRQEVFIAPMWTPAREDLLLELCGEIEDEDSSLLERAEDRAERFEGYHERRGAEAAAARDQVQAIGARFEFGQPILVGHHSERRARKDKERMDNGMRKAVKLWETAEYWQQRAAAAVRHAQYKERPDVRYRRIKTLQTAQRKHQRSIDDSKLTLMAWTSRGFLPAPPHMVLHFAGFERFTIRREGKTHPETLYSLLREGALTTAEAIEHVVRFHTRSMVHNQRWVDHYANRIAYEKAMLGEAGGLEAEAFDIQPGGRVLIGSDWLVVRRVNRVAGAVVSVTVHGRYVPVRGIEEVQDYRAPTAEEAATVKAATTLPPLRNYPGEGFHHMTNAEWKATHADYKGSRQLGQGAARSRPGSGRPDIKPVDQGPEVGRHRVRTVVRQGRLIPVFITDAKRTDPPAALATPQPVAQIPAAEPDRASMVERPAHVPKTPTDFDAMRAQLRAGGVQVVSAPQLFPTPQELAERVVREARLSAGDRVLEPSAGTGALLRAMPGLSPFGGNRQTFASVVAVEINRALAESLRVEGLAQEVHCADFLDCTPQQLGRFEVVVMNPPFADAADIRHIEHARQFLMPGGRLVAICANGPRQQAALEPVAQACGGFYQALPAGSFESVGTSVNTALVVIHG